RGRTAVGGPRGEDRRRGAVRRRAGDEDGRAVRRRPRAGCGVGHGGGAGLMLGTSRWSLQAASEALVERSRTSAAGLTDVGRELFAVANLLESSGDLRRLLSDGGTAGERRRSVATRVLGTRVRHDTLEVVADLASRRWSAPADLVDSVEYLAAQALFLAAEDAGRLDTVEDELYRVSRIAEGTTELRAV